MMSNHIKERDGNTMVAARYSVKTSTDVGQWFLNRFDDALEAGWLKCQDVFKIKKLRQVFRYSNPVVKRAKRIQIGDAVTIILVLKATRQDMLKTDISLRVYPNAEQPYLPEGLKLTILSESGEERAEIRVIRQTARIEHPLKHLKNKERFGFRIDLGETCVTEYFVI